MSTAFWEAQGPVLQIIKKKTFFNQITVQTVPKPQISTKLRHQSHQVAVIFPIIEKKNYLSCCSFNYECPETFAKMLRDGWLSR